MGLDSTTGLCVYVFSIVRNHQNYIVNTINDNELGSGVIPGHVMSYKYTVGTCILI